MNLQDKGQLVESRTVILDLRVRSMSFRKSLGLDDLFDSDDDKPDPEFVHVSKDLISRKELKEIRNLDMTFKRDLYDLALPTELMRGGLYIVSIKSVLKVKQRIDKFLKERNAILDGLLNEENYARIIKESQERLGDHFDRSQYPPADYIRARYTVSYQIFTISVGKSLEEFSVELAEDEKKKLEALFKEEQVKRKALLENAHEDFRSALRIGFLNLIQELEDKLTPENGGKTKILRESKVDSLISFIENWNDKDITNDVELGQMVQKAKEVISGVHFNKLRYSTDVRTKVLETFHNITQELSSMVVTASSRKFSNPEEEV
jgi:hypothetical protein